VDFDGNSHIKASHKEWSISWHLAAKTRKLSPTVHPTYNSVPTVSRQPVFCYLFKPRPNTLYPPNPCFVAMSKQLDGATGAFPKDECPVIATPNTKRIQDWVRATQATQGTQYPQELEEEVLALKRSARRSNKEPEKCHSKHHRSTLEYYREKPTDWEPDVVEGPSDWKPIVLAGCG
jgi:hypothetical protein